MEKSVSRRGRPQRNEGERLRERMRTVALVRELMRRSGVDNPNRFARWFDEEMRRRHPGRPWETESSGKWRKNYVGLTVLTEEQLSLLVELFPGVWRFYYDGPERLWEALWCSDEKLWNVCRLIGAEYDDQPGSEHSVLAGVELTFDESLYNMESNLLTKWQYAQDDDSDTALVVGDLAESISLWRMHRRLNAIARTEGVGAYRSVQMCFAAPVVRKRLHELGVLDDLFAYVVNVEARRIESEHAYRDSIAEACFGRRDQEFDATEYALDPFRFCSVEKRMADLYVG
ncbi:MULTISPECIES: hypothetical protein [Burkholderia]|uniref:hypothetical protein n=1 Tax=Burkholderia TaxID=32008 RepID=UPI000B319A65|nr:MULTISPECIES: hypothetical protein [Burkholderia]